VQTRRWVNQTLPQTLQIAVFLLYINAVFRALDILRFGVGNVLGSGVFGLLFFAELPGGVGGGYGIANEKKWGYIAGVVVAFLPFVTRVYFNGVGNLLSTDAISLLFEIALVCLLLHPQSRDYQRLWFK
jgi:hypothetical protein